MSQGMLIKQQQIGIRWKYIYNVCFLNFNAGLFDSVCTYLLYINTCVDTRLFPINIWYWCQYLRDVYNSYRWLILKEKNLKKKPTGGMFFGGMPSYLCHYMCLLAPHDHILLLCCDELVHWEMWHTVTNTLKELTLRKHSLLAFNAHCHENSWIRFTFKGQT